MIVRLNVALRNKILDSIFNSGSAVSMFDSGTIEFRTGSQPASADDAAVGTVVETVNLPADAMAAASAGTIAKTVTAWQDLSADAGGTITWARFKSAGNTYIMDIDVTSVAVGTGGILIDNPVVVAGQSFIVTAFQITMPAST